MTSIAAAQHCCNRACPCAARRVFQPDETRLGHNHLRVAFANIDGETIETFVDRLIDVSIRLAYRKPRLRIRENETFADRYTGDNMSEKKTGLPKFLTWIMMGFVMVGLLGFGAVSFNESIQSVGSVGDTEIPVDDYARGLPNFAQRRSLVVFFRLASRPLAFLIVYCPAWCRKRRLRMRPRRFLCPLGMMRCATKSWITPFAA